MSEWQHNWNFFCRRKSPGDDEQDGSTKRFRRGRKRNYHDDDDDDEDDEDFEPNMSSAHQRNSSLMNHGNSSANVRNFPRWPTGQLKSAVFSCFDPFFVWNRRKQVPPVEANPNAALLLALIAAKHLPHLADSNSTCTFTAASSLTNAKSAPKPTLNFPIFAATNDRIRT